MADRPTFKPTAPSASEPANPTAEIPGQDECPTWAAVKIKDILELEIRLGNITPHAAALDANIASLSQRLSDPDAVAADEVRVETLFVEVCRGLDNEGFGADEIAAFVNRRVRGVSRLPYCSVTEVEAALAHPDPAAEP